MCDPTSIDSEWLARNDPHDSSEQPELPRQLGDYELLREIGRGGMGVVYEARQISLERRVALKVLPPAVGLHSQAIQRFKREAHAAAKLHHTNIVPVYAIGHEQGSHFYAMELVDGDSLDRLLSELRDGRTNPLLAETVTSTVAGTGGASESAIQSSVTSSLSDASSDRGWFDTVARLIADVADALHYAHDNGVIHRDVKPANLLLSPDDRLMVTDFGLARLTEETGLTLSGAFMGTPAYMSPEQIAAGRVSLDHRTDVYSLGAVLYEFLTLRVPFPGDSREEVISGIMTKDPRPPRRFNRRIPLDLETICLKAMEKDPDRRYSTARALAEDLRRYLIRGLVVARRAGFLRRFGKSCRRHPVTTTIATSAILLALASVGFTWRMMQLESRETVNRAIADAKMQMDAGLYRQGLEKIEQALAADPDSAAARLVGARLLMKLGRTREAVGEARAVLRKDPNDWTAHLVLAIAAKTLPSISAEEHSRIVQTHAPDSAEAYYLRSLVAETSAEKLALLDRALEMNPGDAEALADRAGLLTDEIRDHPAALRDCDLLIAVRPRSAQGRRIRARVYADQQDHGRALEEIESAIRLDPGDAANFETRAQIYGSVGRHEDAVADFGRAIELDPGYAPFYAHRAGARNNAGRFELALKDAEKALRLDPEGRQAYLPLFHAYLRLDRKTELRQALDDLRLSADGWVDPKARAWAYREISAYFRVMKEFDRALELAAQAIATDPRDYRGYTNRARIHDEIGHDVEFEADCNVAAEVEVTDATDLIERGMDLGWVCRRWELALENYNRLVERFPNWHRAYYGRAACYAFLDRLDKTLEDYDRAIELAPNNARAYSNRAVMLERMDRWEEGVESLDRAIELDPQSPLLYSNRGYFSFVLGRLAQAQEDLAMAIELDPLYGTAYTNRASVLGILGKCKEAMNAMARAEEVEGSDAWVQHGLAWNHLNVFVYECPQQYDPAKALDYLRRASDVAADATDPILGHALYRNGSYERARQIIVEVHRAKRGSGPWFVLSMCTWQLGRKEEARRYFDQSVAWMDRHNPDGPILLRQREEAARLLGEER